MQSFVYSFNDIFSAGMRGEIWRDADGFYVASFAENDDALDSLRGGDVTLDPRTVGGGRTTYGAITVGVNIKPPIPKPAAGSRHSTRAALRSLVERHAAVQRFDRSESIHRGHRFHLQFLIFMRRFSCYSERAP